MVTAVGESGVSRRRPGSYLLAWLVGVVGAVLRVGWDPPRTVAASVSLGVIGLLVVVCFEIDPDRSGRWFRAGVVGSTTVLTFVVAMAGYAYPVAVVVVGTTTAYGAAVRWSLVRRWPQRRVGVVGPAIGVLVVASLSWYRLGSPIRFAALAVAAIGILEFYSRRVVAASTVDAAIGRIAHVIAVAVGGAIAAVVIVLVVVPINLVSRIFGYSSLDGGWTTPRSAWIPVDPSRTREPGGSPRDVDRMAVREDRPTKAVRRRGHLRLVVPVVAVLVLALAVQGEWKWPWASDDATAASTGGTFTRKFEEDPAFAHAPWARNLRLGLLDAWSNLEFNAAVGGWQIRDVRSKYINVEHGERRTTQPDASLGRPLEVWFLGGSAAFGAGQRDDHTIPSELVRLAGAARVPLHVRNMAVPATVNWQSAMLLIERLEWEPRPDLVILYDGANDLALQEVLANRGEGSSDRPASLIDGDLDAMLRARAKAAGATDVSLPDVVPTTPERRPGPTAEGQLVSSRYLKGLEVIRRASAQVGVPVVSFWQPEIRTKQPLSGADRRTLESVDVGSDLDGWRTYSAAARTPIMAAGVTDLTGVFDGEKRALYWDTVHTNELGAQLVARAIFDHLDPLLQGLLRSGGG